MHSRRRFLHEVVRGGAAAALGAAAFADDAMARVHAASEQVSGRTPADVAADEDYWREIQGAFTLDRTIVNLNNGGCCPSPRVVHEAFKRYLDIQNQSPVYHMWQILEPGIESVRRGWLPSSAATPRRWPSLETPARRCRSRSSASTSRPATRW